MKYLSLLIIALIGLLQLGGKVAAETNGQRFARGLGPLPPRAPGRNGAAMFRRAPGGPSMVPPPAATQTPPTNGTPVSGFAQSCRGIRLVGGSGVLRADCDGNAGPASGSQSQLNLNSCLVNDNGRLAARANGNAFSSCNSCTISGTILSCVCSPNTGSTRTTIDLNTLVANNAGRLQCFGTIA